MGIAWFIYYFAITDTDWGYTYSRVNSTEYILEIFSIILMIIMILFMASTGLLYDAIHFRARIKLTLVIMAAIFLTLSAAYYSFFSSIHGRDDSVIYIKSINVSISLLSMIANGFQIWSIFLWRYVIFSVMKKDKCATVQHSPYKIWLDGNRLALTPLTNSETNNDTEVI